MSNDPWDDLPDNGLLRDAHGDFLGHLERRSDGTEWMTEYPDNQYVGRYDPQTNQTWDVNGNFVGFGNLLGTLIRRR